MGVMTARILAACALLCWTAAWFLPVIEHYAGWAAFRAALAGPFKEGYPGRGQESIPQLLSALTNVVFVVMLYLWHRGRVRNVAIYLKVAITCVLVNLYWPVQMLRAGVRDGLLIGYYLWLAAFVLLLALAVVTAVSGRRTSRTPMGDTPA
jgi:hypothetical protein